MGFLAENKATSRVLKALGLFGGVQVVGILCGLVRNKLVSVWIGPAGVGLFAIFNSVVDMLSPATQLNLRQSSVKELSQADEATMPQLAAAVRWWACRLGMLGAVVMLLLSPALSLASFGDCSWWWAFALLSVAMFALAVANGEQAVLQGAGRLRRLARAGVWGAVAGLVLSLPVIYWLRIQSIIPSIIICALAVAGASMAAQDVRVPRIASAKAYAMGKGFLQLGACITIASLATTAAHYAFVSFLNQQASEYETGIYQAGYVIMARYLGMVFAAIGMEYYPRLSKIAADRGQASAAVSHEMTVLVCVITPIVVGMVFADELLIRLLYSDQFIGAKPMVEYGIVGALPQAMSYCMAFVMLARGDGKAFVATDICSAAIGLGLDVCFYLNWGIAGLGVAYAVWYFIYAAMTWAVCRWRYGIGPSLRSVGVALAALAVIAGAILLKNEL